MANQHTSRSSGRALDGFHREGAISVGPVPGGWRLEASVCGQGLMFLSGACAERQARALARRLAGLGYDMRVEVRDRRNAVAGQFRYPAAPAAPDGVDTAFGAAPWTPL
jgi:hypothetical protein